MADSSQVFLGLPDQRIEENDDKLCNWSTNKFGGRPSWMTSLVDQYPSCKLCKRQLLLVSQIYCPLSGSLYHRTLYIFGCVNPSCWNQPQSWTILRSQVLEKNDYPEADKNAVKSNSVDDWGDDTGDWGDADDWNDPVITELEYAASKLSLNPMDTVKDTNQLPVKTDSSTKPLISNNMNQDAPRFHPFYINVFETNNSNKKTGETSLTSHEKQLLLCYQEQEGVSINEVLSLPNHSNAKQDEIVTECYEKTIVAHGDKGFHRFQKHLQQCPQQCIRYEWNGMPLSISSSTASDIMSAVPRCQYCGSQRVYELQLMPALVVLLKIKESSLHSALPETSDKPRTNPQYKQISDDKLINGRKDSNRELDTPSEDISSKNQGIEFGTVIVFSCGKSCWDDSLESCSLREEFLVVQPDPDAELFKNKI
ncbi:programmed cell death protein 2-like [Actinia tenebrosa]|uniref:Programmed cell death protein 2-like n=1 Tax=Actinia tenebrosa TaxID=6105 RepID=A0A6P8IKB5_ACTTE|nr:programmed cell death protein 2-like [Actinia tenebrosa]